MRAFVYDQYGGTEGLRMAGLPAPQPAKGEVLVRVAACALNRSDWEFLTGTPAYARIGGLTRPGRRILGSDIAGTVVATGAGVTEFAKGDRVFGDILSVRGGLAEQVCAPAAALSRLPEDLDFATACTLPQAGVIALQGLGTLAPDQRVLVNGAGGGAGTFAIQLAKAAGAHVTAVDTAGKAEAMTALGADRTIDYARTDFAAEDETGYDVILDLWGTRPMGAVRRALAPGGRYRMVGGPVRVLLAAATAGPLMSVFGSRSVGVLALKANRADQDRLASLVLADRLVPQIDGTWPLERAGEALDRIGAGTITGKAVILVDEDLAAAAVAPDARAEGVEIVT